MGNCPKCQGVIADAHNVTGKGLPKEGDVAICSSCESFVIFLNNGSWATMPEDFRKHLETYEPMTYGFLSRALKAVKEAKAAV